MTATAARRGGRSAIGVGRTRVPLRSFYAAILVLLYLPIAILFVFSFNAGTTLSFPLEGLTLEWYGSVFDNSAMLEAARNSFVVGVGSATLATLLGCAVAIAVLRFRFRGRGVLLALAGLPLIVPFVVMGVAFFSVLAFCVLGPVLAWALDRVLVAETGAA